MENDDIKISINVVNEVLTKHVNRAVNDNLRVILAIFASDVLEELKERTL